MSDKDNKSLFSRASGVTSSLEESFKKLTTQSTKLTGLLGIINGRATDMGSIVQPFSQVQDAAIELAKAVGLSSKSIMATATRTIEQNAKMQLSMSYNISSPEMLKLQGDIMAQLGRNVAIDQVGTIQRNANGEVVNPNFDSELENLIAARQVFGGPAVAGIVAGFDRLGKNMNAAAKTTGKLFQEASEYGINLQKYTDNFINNLDMAQTYTFSKGVDGLREMARKATEIRQDMSQIAAFAEKVGTVTGAVETAAQLQVLGGSFAALANPLAMLNESLTDMEGLQDRLIGMTEGAAFYNQATHQIEMDPFTRMQLKRAAEVTGQDPRKFIDQAYAQARRGEIQRQMEGVGNISDEVKRLLPNVGEIDERTGAAGATINGKFYDIGTIAGDTKLQAQLIEETRSESDDIKVIAKSVMGIRDIMEGKTKQVENAAALANITPGAINGLSSYDIVMDFMTKEFTPNVINGAKAVDSFTQSLAAFGKSLENRLIIGGIGTLDAKSPAEWGNNVNKFLTDFLGDSGPAQAIATGAEKMAKSIGDFLEGINNYTSEKGYNILSGFKAPAPGMEGAEALPAKANTGAVLEGISPDAQEVLRSSMAGSATVTVTGGAPSGVRFTAAKDSLPGVSVAATQGGYSAGQSGAATQNTPDVIQTVKHEFTVNGKFTFEGDKGEITSDEIMDIFKRNPEFARQFMNMLERAVQEKR